MTTNLHAPLARYAARLHATAGDRHHVASPLGAWLLLALCASAAPEGDAAGPHGHAAGPDGNAGLDGHAGLDGDAAALADALGTAPARAARIAADLLDAPHPLVPSATAVWHRPGTGSAGLDAWRAALPRATGTGPLPDQAGLDAWAREHSLGLIERFPLALDPRVALALASAVATRISWAAPFDLAPAGALGPDSPWAGRLTRVLRTPAHGHRAWIAATPEAGDVAVHVAAAQPAVDGGHEAGGADTGTDGSGGATGAGLSVVSVAAAPGVAPPDVLAAAYRIAADADEPAGRRSLFDLPLGETTLWTLREEAVRTFAPDRREQRHTAALPCWSARDEHDLTGLGFTAAGRVLAPLVGAGDVRARQAVAARYDRYGFAAAAVTGMFARVSLPPLGVARVAELRFGHPYAVVAVATDRRGGGTGPWHGVPVFSGWVAEPDDVAAADLADPPGA
ncbi:hypothetical protein [Micromonospora carbonacea]|uniref:Serpin (Serine protease inhibitor) n=1 Tax=Micromonospora carbonacea TaxID=47853 RepID=A0A7H8XLK1_9ACTN|nr:hypothetical protein [Micromonospora carbonacea]MBB5826141.1 hypothetical protein [Micromonospora carbonacea]QLD25704.1 hypothetical protein HXZ27_17045 [Micromonospora carbonacea]